MANPAIPRLLLAASLPLVVWSQVPGVPAAAPPAQQAPVRVDPLGRDTPRGAVVNFLRAVNDSNLKRAARYLQTSLQPSRAERLAKELGTVLDRRLRIDTERLSNRPEGDPNDDVQIDRDRIGTIDSARGPIEVVLQRVPHESGRQIWLFSGDTLSDIPYLYESTDNFWLESHVPEPIRDINVLGLPLWRWLLWAIGLIIAFLGSAILQSIVHLSWRPLLRRLDPDHPTPVALALSAPLRVFLFALIVMYLSSFAATILSRELWFKVGAIVAIFSGGWLLSRLVDAIATVAGHRLQRRTGATHDSTIWLMQRAGKFVVALAGLLCLLAVADIELTGILTGLGIGGLAIAFAAQKTIENLFGGVMITTDQSIRVGDTCKVGTVSGTIVDIGIRSTRIRTPDRTLVSIPNGQTATVSIENLSQRDKFHFLHVIGVRYQTDAAAMRALLNAIRELLASNSYVEKETIRVRFIRFGPSSLDIELRAYLLATGFDEFLEKQELLLLAVMELLTTRGVGIAFPSQTLYVAKDS